MLILIGGRGRCCSVASAVAAAAPAAARLATRSCTIVGRRVGAIAAVGPAVATGSPTRPGPYERRVAARSAIDGFSRLLHRRDLRRRSCSPRCSPTATCAARGSTGPRLYVLMLLSASGGMIMASANDLIVHVPRPRDPVDRRLRAGRHAPAPARGPGGGHQVLRARRLLVGVLPLRHRPRLRRHRHHEPGRRSPTSCADRPRSTDERPAARRLRRCCSSASASRSRPCRSTRGRPTCTRARRRPSSAFMASAREGGRLRRAARGCSS